MARYEGDGYAIEHRWKEELIYWEGCRGFLFDGGWGVDPPALYVPDAATWPEAVPEWLRDRRDVVLARLAERGDRIVETPEGYDTPSRGARCVSP